MITTFHPTLLQGLTLIVSVLLPIMVSLVTTKVASSTAKAILLLVLSLVTSVVSAALSAVQNNNPFDLWGALYTFGTVFIVGVASFFGLWKPTGVADAAQKVLVTSKPGPEHSAEDPVVPPVITPPTVGL